MDASILRPLIRQLSIRKETFTKAFGHAISFTVVYIGMFIGLDWFIENYIVSDDLYQNESLIDIAGCIMALFLWLRVFWIWFRWHRILHLKHSMVNTSRCVCDAKHKHTYLFFGVFTETQRTHQEAFVEISCKHCKKVIVHCNFSQEGYQTNHI